jgi:hypothetical protein
LLLLGQPRQLRGSVVLSPSFPVPYLPAAQAVQEPAVAVIMPQYPFLQPQLVFAGAVPPVDMELAGQLVQVGPVLPEQPPLMYLFGAHVQAVQVGAVVPVQPALRYSFSPQVQAVQVGAVVPVQPALIYSFSPQVQAVQVGAVVPVQPALIYSFVPQVQAVQTLLDVTVQAELS